MSAHSLLGLPSHSLEQHFLTHAAAIDRIVTAAGVRAGDCVLELGSGVGTISARLVHSAPSKAQITMVDLDPGLCRSVRTLAKNRMGASVVCGDALSVLRRTPATTVVIANLPSSLSSPLFAALAALPSLRTAVVTVAADDDLTPTLAPFVRRGFTLGHVGMLHADWFSPEQPFASRVLQINAATHDRHA